MGSRLVAVCIVLIAAPGCWYLSMASSFYAKAWLANHLIDKAWQETLKGKNKVRPWPWADTWPVAELSIPRLGIRQIVLLGDSGRVLAFGPGQSEGLSKLGESGLSVISGHRDTSFHFLKSMRTSDDIIIQTVSGKFHYRVIDARIVDQRHVGIDSQISDLIQGNILMLVTCFPFEALQAGGDLRYIVIAEALSKSSILLANNKS